VGVGYRYSLPVSSIRILPVKWRDGMSETITISPVSRIEDMVRLRST